MNFHLFQNDGFSWSSNSSSWHNVIWWTGLWKFAAVMSCKIWRSAKGLAGTIYFHVIWNMIKNHSFSYAKTVTLRKKSIFERHWFKLHERLKFKKLEFFRALPENLELIPNCKSNTFMWCHRTPRLCNEYKMPDRSESLIWSWNERGYR
jgi:hypothetical protein